VFGRFAQREEEELLHALLPGDEEARFIGETVDCGTCAHVSSDGERVLTLTLSADERFTIVRMNIDGTDRQVLEPPAGMSFSPGPFRDSSFFYVTGSHEDDPAKTGIYAGGAAAYDGLEQLTTHDPTLPLEVLAVTADGSRLLLIYPTDEQEPHDGHLYLMETEGGPVRRLNPDGTVVAWLPSTGAPGSFSPAGDRIAFAARDLQSGRAAVYVAEAAGGQAQRISDPGSGTVTAQWSPAEDVIAFEQRTTSGYELHLLAVDTKTDSVLGGATAATEDEAWAPVWSPSGDWLLFQRGSDLQYDLWAIRRDGSRLIRLTDHPAGYGGVTWAP
jgi:Tol biopolymer transport system component